MAKIKLFGGETVPVSYDDPEWIEKAPYSVFVRRAGSGNAGRDQDLYQKYLLSPYEDIGMFLANFRGEG